MQATAITMMGQRKPDEDARRRAMVRLNGMMFYSVAIASFLESTRPLDTARLIRLAQGCEGAVQWIEQEWLARRAERGRQLREYIEAMWPEFDWSAAYQEFRDAYLSRTAARVGAPGLALEFLARCATETALAVFYRTLAKSADEPSLRALVAAAAHEHVAYFGHFRGLFARLGRGASVVASVRAVVNSCSAAREVDVATAFLPLAHHWHGGWVFPELAYPEFLSRLAQLIRRHAALGLLERILFTPWLKPPRSMDLPGRPAPAANGRKNTRVAPLLHAA